MRLSAIAMTALALLAAGCAEIHVAQDYKGVHVDGGRVPAATVEIENSGWYLLTFIPIASGDVDNPNRCTCFWFRNTVHLDNNLRALDHKMKELGVDEVTNLTSHRTDEKYLVFIMARRAYHTSAVLLKPEAETSK